MIYLKCPLCCAGAITPNAKSCGLIGMGIARPQCAAERAQHRPNISNPRTVTDGREQAKQHQLPCSHWTRAKRPAAADASPSERVMRCRQVPKGSEVTAMDRQPDPDPRTTCAAALMVCNGLSPAPLGSQRALCPDDGRSVRNRTPHLLADQIQEQNMTHRTASCHNPYYDSDEFKSRWFSRETVESIALDLDVTMQAVRKGALRRGFPIKKVARLAAA